MLKRLLKFINLGSHNAKSDISDNDYEEPYKSELETISIGGYIISKTKGIDIDNDILDILSSLEPLTEQFRLQQSSIIIRDTLAEQNGMRPNGYTWGLPYSTIGHRVNVASNSQHTLIHELGHVIDRVSDQQKSLPWTSRPDFKPIESLYLNEIYPLLNGESVEKAYYLTSREEIFAHLFEQYFKNRFPEIELGKTTTKGIAGYIAEKVFANKQVQDYFDEKLQYLYVNMAQNKSGEALKTALGDLQNNSISL